MAQQVPNLLKFSKFYDQIEFSTKQCLAITKAIIKLSDLSGGSGLAKRMSQEGSRFKDNTVVFHENDR